MKQNRFFTLVSAIWMFFLWGASAYAGTMQAGAARVSITPTVDEFPFTAPREKPFVGVHDPLYARALVLQDEKQNRLALVSLEVSAIPQASALVSDIAQAAGVPISHVLLTATHTHNSLLVSYHGGEPGAVHAQEIARLRRAAVEATRAALQHLQPAKIAFARGQAFVNINNGEAAGLQSWNDPQGFSDKTLDVIRVESSQGAPLALVVNYATHAEVMFRSVTKDGGYEVSGDLPGAVSHLLEGQAAPVVLFTSAAEADQLPLFKSLQPATNLAAADEGAGGWALLNVQARRLANSVLDVAATLPPASADGTLSAAVGSVTCPGKARHPQATNVPPVTIPISLLRLRDIDLAGVGGDLAAVLGKKIKDAAPNAKTTVITMTAGAVGYILPDSSYIRPGHGVMGSPLQSGCAENALLQGFAQLARQLQ